MAPLLLKKEEAMGEGNSGGGKEAFAGESGGGPLALLRRLGSSRL